MILLLSQISVLGCIAYQDFKSRSIAWYFIPAVMALSLLTAFSSSTSFLWLDWGMSLAFLVTQFALVYLYFAIRLRSIRLKFVDELLGLGDVLFLVAMIPFFSFKSYLLYYSLSLVFSLLAHLVASKVVRKSKQEADSEKQFIPLLGWMGLFFIGVFIYEYLNTQIQGTSVTQLTELIQEIH